jgi:hypothetical protein
MKATQSRVGLNELLDRPSILAFNVVSAVLSFVTQDLILLLREACLTPELTGREASTPAPSLAMTGKLIPLRSNELLGRPLILPFNCRSRLPVLFIQLDSLWMRSGLTPELTGRDEPPIRTS